MASIVAKRPVVGVAAGIIFAALGSLLLSVKGTQQGMAGVASGLYTVAGYFLLLVAALSLVAGVVGITSRFRGPGSGVQDSVRHQTKSGEK